MIRIPAFSQIANQLHSDQSQYLSDTIGCVIDITRPVYRQKQENYIIEIKIIDQSLNQSAETHLLIKYLSVYLVSDKKQDLRLSLKIGDFIYLQKFIFSIWNKIKIVTKYYGTIQCLYQINSGEIQQNQEFIVQKKIGKQSYFDVQSISSRIVELKHWISLHFRQVFNPFLGVKIINNFCSLIQPFSIFLKIERRLKNQFQDQLVLADNLKNIFYFDSKEFSFLLFHQKEWVYLRGIQCINTDHQIVLTETGNIIKLPMLFSQDFERQSNYQAIYRKTNKISSSKKQTTSLTYITLFDQKPSSIKQLFDLQDKYKATTKKEDIILQNNYLIKGAVVKYTGRIKLYHTEYQMIVHEKYLEDIPGQQKRETINDQKLSYVFQGSLFVMDKSVLSKKQILKIKLFTNDSKSLFFDEKQLSKLLDYIGHSNSEEKINQSSRNINEKLQKLLQFSSFQNPVSLVLQPIRSDQLIFRLINTKIT